MRHIRRLPAIAAGMLLPIVLLYLSVASFAFDARMYPQSPPPYNEMGIALADYLSEKLPALPDTLFNEQERLHMDDVLGLFTGGRRLALWAGTAAVLLILLSLWRGGRRETGRGLMAGFAVFFGLCLCIGLWAALDYVGWFTAMHELVFDNDLWLFDPATSALIRMLPLSFFISATKQILLRFAIAMACLLALACGLGIGSKGRKVPWNTQRPSTSA